MTRLSIVIAFVFLLTSCRFLGGERISGNGHIVTHEIPVGSFTDVKVSGGIKLHVLQDATTSVKLETDENLVQYFDIYTNGNTLVIRSREGFNPRGSKEVIVYVAAPVFKDIHLSGACDII